MPEPVCRIDQSLPDMSELNVDSVDLARAIHPKPAPEGSVIDPVTYFLADYWVGRYKKSGANYEEIKEAVVPFLGSSEFVATREKDLRTTLGTEFTRLFSGSLEQSTNQKYNVSYDRSKDGYFIHPLTDSEGQNDLLQTKSDLIATDQLLKFFELSDCNELFARREVANGQLLQGGLVLGGQEFDVNGLAALVQYSRKNSATTVPSDEWVGLQFPKKLMGTTIDGAQVSVLPQTKENYILITTWGTWCGPCVEEMKVFHEYQKESKTLPVEQVYIASPQDSIGAVKSFLRKNDYTENGHLKVESKVFEQLRVGVYPTNILMTNSGVIIHADGKAITPTDVLYLIDTYERTQASSEE